MGKKGVIVKLNSFFSDMTSHLPDFASFEKVAEEFLEHKDFAIWVFVRLVVPIIVFNLLINFFLFERFRFSPLIFGIAIFFYSTFLVDLDSFFIKRDGAKEATFFQRGLILFFAPVVIYYLLSNKMRPVYVPNKYFHRVKSMLIFTCFVFVCGTLIFFNLPDALFFALFGLIGYGTHLVADGIVRFR